MGTPLLSNARTSGARKNARMVEDSVAPHGLRRLPGADMSGAPHSRKEGVAVLLRLRRLPRWGWLRRGDALVDTRVFRDAVTGIFLVAKAQKVGAGENVGVDDRDVILQAVGRGEVNLLRNVHLRAMRNVQVPNVIANPDGLDPQRV